jgi:hypothetical protein
VVFHSWASNLAAEDDINDRNDVFMKDMLTGVTTRESTDSNGLEANQSCTLPAISADGRYVVFESGATNLVASDANGGVTDIFLKDTQTGITTRVNTDSNGVQANDGSEAPAVSGDGRYVVFRSNADNLVAGDINEMLDIFLKDTVTNVTTRMSTDSSGVEGNSDSDFANISSDGRYVVFTSYASNLVAGDTNDATDVFIKNRETGTTTLVSTSSSGAQGNDESVNPTISSDGRYVVFESYATNLITGDTNAKSDIFLKDTVTGVTTRVSTDSNGVESNNDSQISGISADGRYVVFDSYASNLVANDTNATSDIFLKDTETGLTTRVSVNSSGTQGNNLSEHPVISSDGSYIAFKSAASNLVVGDIGGFVDMFRVMNPFVSPTYHDLTITLAGSGSGTVTSVPAGIDCGSTCSNSFVTGTLVTLTATADTASVFVSGTGDTDCEDGVVTMITPISCIATFELDSDGDGILDDIEDSNQDDIVDAGETDPNNPDTDGDGLSDGVEDVNYNGVVDSGETDPLLADSDSNGTPDGDEDIDGDGFTNGEELTCESDPADPSSRCRRGLPFLMLLLD